MFFDARNLWSQMKILAHVSRRKSLQRLSSFLMMSPLGSPLQSSLDLYSLKRPLLPRCFGWQHVYFSRFLVAAMPIWESECSCQEPMAWVKQARNTTKSIKIYKPDPLQRCGRKGDVQSIPELPQGQQRGLTGLIHSKSFYLCWVTTPEQRSTCIILYCIVNYAWST